MNHEDLTTKHTPKADEPSLLDRVVQIIEQARANVVRAVNSSMVKAYWLIGREIVLALQGGDERAGDGKQAIENLSERLTHRYGKGFSTPTLLNFRQFYQGYALREPAILSPAGRELTTTGKSCSMGSALINGFSSQLSRSHYRALMRVAKPDEVVA